MIYLGNMMLEEFKASMKTKFEMIDLGFIKYFLGIDVEQYFHGILVCHQNFATNILKRFRMEKFKLTTTPISL
jgi:hypothetical protein